MPPSTTLTIRLADDQVVALRRATNAVAKLAATAPRSFMLAIRAGMRLQRAIDGLRRVRNAS